MTSHFSGCIFNMFNNETNILTFDTDCWYRDCPTWVNIKQPSWEIGKINTPAHIKTWLYDILMF